MAVRRPSAPSPTPDSGRITVPKLNRDPIQSLRPWPLAVTFHGREYEIPALPAADWLSVLMVEQFHLDDVFPGLLDEEEQEAVADALMQGGEDADDLIQFCLDIVETASARYWWVAMRLIEIARTSWDVVGAELGLRGVDASRISLSSWLDQLLLVILRGMESKDISMFTMKLESPPPQAEVEPEDMVMSRDAFLAMAR